MSDIQDFFSLEEKKNEKTPYVDIELIRGDITTLEIDVVVNAAHEHLTGGGGVDGAIHKAAGQKLLGECLNLYGCSVGCARITGGYDMPCKYIIHTVGPVWTVKDIPEERDDILGMCYSSSLLLAELQGLKSIAFPCISTGAYCFPKDRAAKIAIKSIKKFFNDNVYTYIDLVQIVCFDEENFAEYKKIL